MELDCLGFVRWRCGREFPEVGDVVSGVAQVNDIEQCMLNGTEFFKMRMEIPSHHERESYGRCNWFYASDWRLMGWREKAHAQLSVGERWVLSLESRSIALQFRETTEGSVWDLSVRPLVSYYIHIAFFRTIARACIPIHSLTHRFCSAKKWNALFDLKCDPEPWPCTFKALRTVKEEFGLRWYRWSRGLSQGSGFDRQGSGFDCWMVGVNAEWRSDQAAATVGDVHTADQLAANSSVSSHQAKSLKSSSLCNTWHKTRARQRQGPSATVLNPRAAGSFRNALCWGLFFALVFPVLCAELNFRVQARFDNPRQFIEGK